MPNDVMRKERWLDKLTHAVMEWFEDPEFELTMPESKCETVCCQCEDGCCGDPDK